MRVLIRTVAHKDQPYDTQGEWKYLDNESTELAIETSELSDWRMEQACAVHEYIEALLCKQDGVSAAEVCEFDILYERSRKAVTDDINDDTLTADEERRKRFGCTCLIDADSEPGADIHAPYHSAHVFADGIERLLLDRLGVKWSDYEAKSDELEYP